MDLNGTDVNSKQANKKEGKEMKKMKAIVSLMLTVAMVLGMSFTTMASGSADKSITIKKSNTVNITKESEFYAYKILDAEEVGADDQIVYTVPDELISFFEKRYKLKSTDSAFAYNVAQQVLAETDMYAFGREVLAAAKAAKLAPSGTGVSNPPEEYVISGLDVGYYVIEDKNGDPQSATMIRNTTEDREIILKADMPDIDKKIDGDNDGDPGSNGPVDNNNEAVGDSVPFVITSKVPDMTGYNKYKFVITDTLSAGLDYNDDIAIKIGGTALNTPDDYVVERTDNSDDGTTTLRIVFKHFIEYAPGSEIEVRYTATLNEDAVIGKEGNSNKAKLEYSNKPGQTEDGDDFERSEPKGESGEKITKTFISALQLEKVDAAGNSLAGAQFQLSGTRLKEVQVVGNDFIEDSDGTYWKLNDGSYTDTDPKNVTDTSKYASTEKKYKKQAVTKWKTIKEDVTITAEVSDDGILIFKGLAAGEYTITELLAPDGYNKLDGDIKITINGTYDGDKLGTYTWSGSYEMLNAKGEVVSKGDLTYDNDNGVIAGLSITNNTGTELPETGGMGTTLFYVVGAVLVIGAAILLIARRRTENAE